MYKGNETTALHASQLYTTNVIEKNLKSYEEVADISSNVAIQLHKGSTAVAVAGVGAVAATAGTAASLGTEGASTAVDVGTAALPIAANSLGAIVEGISQGGGFGFPTPPWELENAIPSICDIPNVIRNTVQQIKPEEIPFLISFTDKNSFRGASIFQDVVILNMVMMVLADMLFYSIIEGKIHILPKEQVEERFAKLFQAGSDEEIKQTLRKDSVKFTEAQSTTATNIVREATGLPPQQISSQRRPVSFPKPPPGFPPSQNGGYQKRYRISKS